MPPVGRLAWCVGLVLLLSACAAPHPATHPATGPAIGSAAQRHWDELLAKGDIAALDAALPAAARAAGQVDEPLQWAASRVRAGHGSAGLPVLLAKFAMPNAIRQATTAPSTGRTWNTFERFAFGFLTYARIVAYVDAASCGDPSAPDGKLRALMRSFPDIDRLARPMAPAEIEKEIDAMLAFEARTWPTRRKEPSRWLCSGGLAEMMDSLKKNGFPAKDATGKGAQSQYGRQVQVARDPDYQPHFNDPAVWTAQREKRRAVIRAVLLKWAGVTP